MNAISLRPRSALAVAIASVGGLLAFCWPLFASGSAVVGAADGMAPFLFAGLLPVVLVVVLFEISEGGLDPKAVAMLGVLSAVGAALRPLGAGTAGLETVFFLLVLAGRVFGAGFGFVLGCTTLFASALITGGVGPWLPYQMLGAAWVGLGAGLLPFPRRGEVIWLALYGAVAGLAYGVAMNLSFWPYAIGPDTGLSYLPGAPVLENLHRFALFSLGSSLGWDLGRAATNLVAILLTGSTILATLRRAARKAAFGAPVEFVPGEPLQSPQRSSADLTPGPAGDASRPSGGVADAAPGPPRTPR